MIRNILLTSLLSLCIIHSVSAQTAANKITRYAPFGLQVINSNDATFWMGWTYDAFKSGEYNGLIRYTDSSQFEFNWNLLDYGALPRIGKSAEVKPSWSKTVNNAAGTINCSFNIQYNNYGTKPEASTWFPLYLWLSNVQPTATQKPANTTEGYVIDYWATSTSVGSSTPNENNNHLNPCIPNPNNYTYYNLKAYHGTLSSDGGTYDVFEGTTAYLGAKQFISVRKTRRTSGTINAKNHLNFWKSKNSALGNEYISSITWAGEVFGKGSGLVKYTTCSIGNP
jgi:hypothetical protein